MARAQVWEKYWRLYFCVTQYRTVLVSVISAVHKESNGWTRAVLKPHFSYQGHIDMYGDAQLQRLTSQQVNVPLLPPSNPLHFSPVSLVIVLHGLGFCRNGSQDKAWGERFIGTGERMEKKDNRIPWVSGVVAAGNPWQAALSMLRRCFPLLGQHNWGISILLPISLSLME